MVGRRFAYWFDFEEDWWHEVTVEEVRRSAPRGKYPKVMERQGDSPPQYAVENTSPGNEGEPIPLRGSVAADTACLIGELHLNKGDYLKAVEAFTRALESSPSVDAYEGRARAYRALAASDERKAGGLR
jgi:hypothetical protein